MVSTFQWLQNEKGRDTTDQSFHKRVVIPRTSTDHGTQRRSSWAGSREHRKVTELPRKIDIIQRRSSWAGCCWTPKSTKITTSNEHHTEKKFLGQKLRNTEKYENFHEKLTSHREEVLGPEVAEHRKIRELPWKIMKKPTSYREEVLGPDVPEHRKARESPWKIDITQRRSSWAGCGRTPTSTRILTKNKHRRVEAPKKKKSRSFIVKTTFKSIPEQRKVRELPRKMHTAEVEEAKKCENYHAKPVSDLFNQDHRRTPKSTRITTKNEHRRSWRAGNYENSHTKRTCKHEST